MKKTLIYLVVLTFIVSPLFSQNKVVVASGDTVKVTTTISQNRIITEHIVLENSDEVDDYIDRFNTRQFVNLSKAQDEHGIALNALTFYDPDIGIRIPVSNLATGNLTLQLNEVSLQVSLSQNKTEIINEITSSITSLGGVGVIVVAENRIKDTLYKITAVSGLKDIKYEVD